MTNSAVRELHWKLRHLRSGNSNGIIECDKRIRRFVSAMSCQDRCIGCDTHLIEKRLLLLAVRSKCSMQNRCESFALSNCQNLGVNCKKSGGWHGAQTASVLPAVRSTALSQSGMWQQEIELQNARQIASLPSVIGSMIRRLLSAELARASCSSIRIRLHYKAQSNQLQVSVLLRSSIMSADLFSHSRTASFMLWIEPSE